MLTLCLPLAHAVTLSAAGEEDTGATPRFLPLADPREHACWHTRGVPELSAGPSPDEPCVLLKLGEIVLKGRNRQQFERLLQNNIRLAIAELGVGEQLWQRDGVVVLSPVPL